MASFVWNTDADGDWSNPLNWSGGTGVPGTGDTVTIDRGAANPTITISTPVNVQSLTTSESIVVTNTLTASSSIRLVDGDSRFESGRIFASAGVTIERDASLQILGSTAKQFGGTLNNEGLLDQQSPLTIGPSSGVINNAATGTWQVSGGLRVDASTSLSINNTGIFRKLGSGSVDFSANDRFTHRTGSSLFVDSGILMLPRSGTTSDPSTGATFNVASGATLELLGPTSYYAGAYVGLGDGRIQISHAIDTRVTSSFPGASFDFAPGLLHWTSGSIFTGNLGGKSFTNLGEMTWSGSTERNLFGQEFRNQGKIIKIDAGRITQTSGSPRLTNEIGGLIEFRGGGIDGGRIVNKGTIRNTSGDTSLATQLFAEPNSLVEATAGRLAWTFGGELTSSQFIAGANAVIEFGRTAGGSNFEVLQGATIVGTGSGRIEFTAGRFQAMNDDAVLDFDPGVFHWQGGDFFRDFRNQGEIIVSGTSSKNILNRFTNVGVIKQLAGSVVTIGAGGVDNLAQAVWELQGDAKINGNVSSNSRINNRGTIRKTGTGTARIVDDNVSISHQSGLIEVREGTLVGNHSLSVLSSGGLFNVAKDSVFEIQGRLDSTGIYEGNGAGKVIANARLRGLDRTFTLNFPENYFQLSTPGALQNAGFIRNVGYLTLHQPTEAMQIQATLLNQGSIVQTAGTNLVLQNFSNTLNYGTWELQGDGSFELVEFDGLSATYTNFGEMRRSGGGVTRITGSGGDPTFSNPGTLNIVDGSLQIEAAHLTQLDPTSQTLAAGKWIVGGAATLRFLAPDETDQPIRTNNASITLAGTSASFPSLDALVANGGSLIVDGARTLVIASNFANGIQRSSVALREIRSSFISTLVGIAIDPTTNEIWSHARNERIANQPIFRRFNDAQLQVGSEIVQPGGPVNVSGIDITSSPLNVGGVTVPSGTLLFIHGQQTPPTLYAMNKITGEVLSTVVLNGSNGNQVGVAHHAARGTVFILDQNETIREINPVDGTTVNSFTARPSGVPTFAIETGGIEVEASSGSLMVVGNGQSQLRLMSPTGTFIEDIELGFTGVNKESLSDISHNDVTGETWVSNYNGHMYRLSPIARGQFGYLQLGPQVKMEVAGNLGLQGIVQLAIAGRPSTGLFATIEATGTATLGGILDIKAGTTFNPASQDTYRLLSFGSRSGTFDQVFSNDFETLLEDSAFFAFADRAPFVDLIAMKVSGPASVVVGNMATIQWTVTNAGSDNAVGPWYDEISLTPYIDSSIDPDDPTLAIRAGAVMGGVVVGSGLTLAPGESTTFTAQIPIRATVLGDYRWVVNTNRRGNVLERGGRLNNTDTSLEKVTVDFRELAIGGPGLQSQFAARGEPQWYKVVVPSDRDIIVELAMDGTGASVNELYVGKNFIPDRQSFQARHSQVGSANVATIIDRSATESTWYITAFPASFDNANRSFRISARVLPAAIRSVSPDRIGDTGTVTVALSGDRLRNDLTYRLVNDANVEIVPSSVQTIDRTRVVLQFEWNAASRGVYDVKATAPDGLVSILEDAITIEATRRSEIEIDVRGSARVRSGRTAQYEVHYKNNSNVDLPLPFITASVEGGGTLRPRYDTVVESSSLVMLAPPIAPGNSMIPAGQAGFLSFYYKAPLDEGPFTVNVWANSIDEPAFASRPLRWDRYAVNLKPATAEASSWNTFLGNERTRYGETFADLFAFLSRQIKELGEAGMENILFSNGEWYFELPELVGPSITRGIIVEDLSSPASAPLIIRNLAALEGESAGGDGRQDIYAVVAGNPTLDLPGSEQDANAWSSFFTKTLNLPGGESSSPQVFAKEKRADKASFLQNIETVKSKADADDLIFVTYAGHGTCRMGSGGKILGGNIQFADAEMSGAELQGALNGQTRTVAVIDACQSAAFTHEITASNVTSIAGADSNQVVQDENSVTHHIVPLLQSNVNRDLHEVFREAGQQQFARSFELYPDSQLPRFHSTLLSPEKAKSWAALVREGRVDRTKSPEEQRQFNESVYKTSGIDSDGDGRSDLIFVDTDGDTKFDAHVTDYDQNGRLNTDDFIVGRIPSTRKPDGTFTTGSPGTLDVTSTPLRQADYQTFEKWNKVNGKRDYGGVAFPVLDARGGELKIDSVDVKKPGGSTTDIEDEQTKSQPKDRVRGERGRSFDPNEKVGPAGFGSAGFLRDNLPMAFSIFFENDPLKATLPAQEVTITEVLDADLDLSTFELGDIVISNRLIRVPAGRAAWSTIVPIVVGKFDLDLQIDAELDFITRTITWKFASLDPTTGVLTNEFDAGFLPVNDALGNGEGNVSYRVRGKSTLASGSQFSGAAEIVFDLNEPLVTNSTLHTIDTVVPTSTVAPLPASSLPSFRVSWSGDDGTGSGVATFDIYVSTNDGPWERWLADTNSTSAEFTGIFGTKYSFVSVASDHVSNRESQSIVADTQTQTTLSPWTNPANRFDVDRNGSVEPLDVLLVINELRRKSVSDPITGLLMSVPPSSYAPPFYDVSQDGYIGPIDVLQIINQLKRQTRGEGELESIVRKLGDSIKPLDAEWDPDSLPIELSSLLAAFAERDDFVSNKKHRRR